MATPYTWVVVDEAGDLLPGLTPTFVFYRDAAGADITPQPAIVERGDGEYGFTPDDVAVGELITALVDNGEGSLPRYTPFAIDDTEARLTALQADVDAIKAQTDLLSASPEDDGISAARLRIGAATTITIRDPFELNLTAAFLRANSMRPLVVGDDWLARFLVLEDGVPVDLTGYTITMSLMLGNGTVVATRTVDVPITDSDPERLQIEIDADQATNNGPLGTTARGWWGVRFGHEEADVTALMTAITAQQPVVNVQVRLTPPAAGPTTWARGVIEILKSYF